MASVYYNEWESYPPAWLRNLIKAGLLPDGDVDERDIRDVKGSDLEGYIQCHFFAGIGGWPLALALAGWPADAPVWTGSCPCQPFSVAGKRMGEEDERHVWPDFARLIGERRPPVVFGEQVASADGRVWLSGIRIDLENMGYAVGAADMCAAGIGAPHIRQRLWWVGNRRVADTEEQRTERNARVVQQEDGGQIAGQGGVALRAGEVSGGVGDSIGERNEDKRPGASDSEARRVPSSTREQWVWADPWKPSDYVHCLDGKDRRIEPGVMPLAHGVPQRVGQIRAYGNAIVPQVAAEFVKAFMETKPCA